MIQHVLSKLLIVFSVLIIMLFNSCVRERDTDTEMASELSFHEFVYHDVFDLANDAASKNTGEHLANYKGRGYCATLTHDETSDPRTIVIDFGAVNCMCNDGRTRKGKVLVSYTGNYDDEGGVHTITFDSYFVNDYQVMGSVAVSNNGMNGASQPFFTSVVEGKVLKPLVEDTLYYTANHTMTWIQGNTTPIWGDDIYYITGTGSGRNALHTFYAMTISEPLIKDVLGCRFFAKGKINMQPQGKALRTIDYGDGTCDNDATVTINTKTFNIKL